MGPPTERSPPEVVAGSGLTDERADIYSLAATLYEMITGARAFPGETHVAMAAVLSGVAPNLRERVPEAPEVAVELRSVRGGARLAGGAIVAPLNSDFELFFHLSGPTDARVLVEVYHPTAVADVFPCIAPDRYAVLVPNASRPEKLWPEARWVAVGKRLHDRGWRPVVLWGSNDEQTLAERIAAGCDGEVPPFLRVHEMAAVLARAQTIVGLDTGFTHLGAAFGRPTVGIYCDHEPGLAGVTGSGSVFSVGGKGQVPTLAEVLTLLEHQHGTAPLPR